MTTLTADQFITYLSWLVFLAIFVLVAVQAIQHPSRANLDIALVFGTTTLVIVIALASLTSALPPSDLWAWLAGSAILAHPYLLLRLVDDLSGVPLRLRRAVEALLIAAIACLWVLPLDRPLWVNSLLLLYIVSVLAYVIGATVRATLRARGVTRRRLIAMTIGSLFLVLNIVVGSLRLWLPSLADLWRSAADLFGLAAGISYVVGFAPPRWLRRAWQDPELRAFLSRAATLPRLPDTDTVVLALEQGAAASVGTPHASIGLWDEAGHVMCFGSAPRRFTLSPDGDGPASRAFRLQQPIFSSHTHYTDSVFVNLQMNTIASAVLAAPITAGTRRLGVLVAYASRAPIFADDDLALIQLLADHAAVILESRSLIDEVARIQAREEATRLKEDFLSAAAHDLKTPLTTLVARAQLLDRRAARDPSAPADRESLQLLIAEGQRLKRLVLDLLDAARVEQGKLVGPREAVDLVTVAQAVCRRMTTPRHACTVVAHDSVVGWYDRQRLEQLLENLVENAIKYCPGGGPVEVSVQQGTTDVRLKVADCGIGIPTEDLPRLFERFHRGANVDDRRFPGMGLGLFICKGIAEQHGGHISVRSRVGEGSIFEITLPLVPVQVGEYAA